MIYRVIAVAALAGTATSHAPGQPETVLFDLGSTSQQASGAVDHVTNAGQIGLLVENAEETLGELTAVGVRHLDGWCGINLAWLGRGPSDAAPAGQKKSAARRPAQAGPAGSLLGGTRVVVRAILDAADEYHDSSARRSAAEGVVEAPLGDRLTEHLFRRGAAAASKLPPEVAAKAYSLALGLTMGHSDLLRRVPLVSRFCREAESWPEWQRRLEAIGSPTMRGRRDLAQHFVVSCALTALLGPKAAEMVGIMKEIRDATGGSGFSFADLSADLAGVTFAIQLRESKLTLAELARSFTVGDFLPENAGVQEDVPWEEFRATFGSTHDERFERQRIAIRERILDLPGYKYR